MFEEMMNIQKEVNKDVLLQIGFKKIKGVAWAADANSINRGYELQVGSLKSVSIFSPDDMQFFFDNSYTSKPIETRQELFRYLFDHLTSFLSNASDVFWEKPEANMNRLDRTEQWRTR